MAIMANRLSQLLGVNTSNYGDRYGSTTSVTPGNPKYSYEMLGVVTTSGKPVSFKSVNPHKFKIILKQFNPLYFSASGMYHNAGYWQTISASGFAFPWKGTINYPGDGIHLENRFSAIEGRALEKVLAQARGAHANLSVDFAEAGQTLAMLRKAGRLRKVVFEFARDVVKNKGYRKIRPGPTQNQRRLDYVNRKWLEYRYGWMPLVNSIYDLVDALRKERVSSLTTLTGRSGMQQEKIELAGSAADRANPERVLKINLSQRVHLSCDFALPTGYTFSDFTSMNPLLIAWELVPFSFIADWFIGVGQCLENWENYFLYRNRFVSGYKTLTQLEDRSYTRKYFYSGYAGTFPPYYDESTGSWTGGNPKDGPSWQSETASGRILYKYKERIKLTSLPTPIGPRVKLGLNSKRFMDIAALVGGYVRKFR